MSSPKSISTLPPAHKSLNYAELRTEGLRYLERMSGKLWTDFNAHDPGITILEVLCYAITELGYRASLPVENLLDDGKPDALRRHFLTAAKALPCSPVTLLDFRKILLDIPGLVNVWLIKNTSFGFQVDCTLNRIVPDTPPAHHDRGAFTLSGLYDILIQPHENATKKEINAIQEKIRRVFHANRNLCTDLSDIRHIPVHDIRVCADVELHTDAHIEQVYAQIHYELQQHFNPPVRRYTLAEMLERGVPAEKIYEGPLLNSGFIDDNELLRSGLKSQLRLSDIIRVIMDVPGVKLIRKIHFNHANIPLAADGKPGEENWTLDIPAGHLPNLCEEKSRFKFFKGLLPFEVDLAEVALEKQKILDRESVARAAIAASGKDLPLPATEYLNAGEYTSIQHDLPRAYGVGAYGVPEVPEAERIRRKAQARQLRGYLLFFDQLLADFMAQLARVRDIFEADSTLAQTYFNQVIADVPELAEAYRDVDTLTTRLQAANGENKAADPENTPFIQRKNRLLDHLLARFGENFSDYVLMMHNLNRKRKLPSSLIDDKTDFLRELEWLGQNRFQAFDFYNSNHVLSTGIPMTDAGGNAIPKPLWYDFSNTPADISLANIAGIEHRAGRLAGMDNVLRRNLSDIEYDLYEEKDADNNSDIRFRVVDTDKSKILLSSSKHYTDRTKAYDEMRLTIQLAMQAENYQLKTAADGRLYFNIVDPQNGNEVVARRIEYFDTENARAKAIEYLIRFLQRHYSEEGFFVVEHLLLRPRSKNGPFLPVCCNAECVDCGPLDPYSYRVHIILPGYTPRFSDMDFRAYFETMLRTELPAHVLPKICWIGKEQMGIFEKRYKTWLKTLQQQSKGKKVPSGDSSLAQLLEILNDLYTIYPEGTLHDCQDDGTEQNPVVLGKTHIGEIKNLPPQV